MKQGPRRLGVMPRSVWCEWLQQAGARTAKTETEMWSIGQIFNKKLPSRFKAYEKSCVK